MMTIEDTTLDSELVVVIVVWLELTGLALVDCRVVMMIGIVDSAVLEGEVAGLAVLVGGVIGLAVLKGEMAVLEGGIAVMDGSMAGLVVDCELGAGEEGKIY